jgi:hypothetical protein
MIASIWPSFGQKPTLTSSIALGSTVNYLISFIIFWLGSLPFIWFPVHKIRHLFTVKAFVAPVGGISLFAWSIARAGGAGPIIHQGSTASGSVLAWGVIAGIMSAVSNFATLIVSDSWNRTSRMLANQGGPRSTILTSPVSRVHLALPCGPKQLPFPWGLDLPRLLVSLQALLLPSSIRNMVPSGIRSSS